MMGAENNSRMDVQMMEAENNSRLNNSRHSNRSEMGVGDDDDDATEAEKDMLTTLNEEGWKKVSIMNLSSILFFVIINFLLDRTNFINFLSRHHRLVSLLLLWEQVAILPKSKFHMKRYPNLFWFLKNP